VRSRSPEAQPELLRRDVVRAFANGDYSAAETAVAQLLRVYPNSTDAYIVLGDIEKSRGRTAQANANYQGSVPSLVEIG
jgi:Flp pilus assembly protein TadD